MKEKKKVKTLTKIKLINWHIFQNETISLKGNTLIFGENGSGKSTLIDAIHYVIDGGKDVKFNSAANTSNQNKRTIESYMRLKTGVEGKEYLRNGDVVTHIALEFFDTVSKENSVIGVCLELIKGNKNANEKFYQLVKSKIDDKFYLQNNENGTFKVNTFAEFSKFIQNNDIRINVFDSSVILYKVTITLSIGSPVILSFTIPYITFLAEKLVFVKAKFIVTGKLLEIVRGLDIDK